MITVSSLHYIYGKHFYFLKFCVFFYDSSGEFMQKQNQRKAYIVLVIMSCCVLLGRSYQLGENRFRPKFCL